MGQREVEEERKADVDFDWKQLLNLLWPDIYSLALAIVVSETLLTLLLLSAAFVIC